jgi:EmrB/QacA subfamily drug resistance transporter
MSAQRLTSQQRWVLGVTAVASFLVALDTLVVSTALSTIRRDLHASLSELEWTVNAYVLSFAVLMMAAAALGDRLGRRKVLSVGLGLFGGASALCALAPTAGWLVAGRALQGAGAAATMPLALTLLGAAFGPEQRGWAMGIFSSVIGFSMLSGPLLGGAVVEGISWHWIFWLNVPTALVVIVLASVLIPESYGRAAALDLPGVALVSAAALATVWGLVRSSDVGWASLEASGPIAAGLVLFGVFATFELRSREPMLPIQLFASRTFTAGNAAMFSLQASLVGALFFMAQYFQTTLGYGPLSTGLRLMPWGATTFIVPQVAGRLIARHGERGFGAGGLALYGASLVWIALIARPGLPYWELVLPLLLSGCGFAFAAPAVQSAVLGSVNPQDIGKASGAMSTLRQLGGAFGVGILAAIFAGAGSYVSPSSFADGFAAVIGAAGVIGLIGALAAGLLPGGRSAAVATAASMPDRAVAEVAAVPADASLR